MGNWGIAIKSNDTFADVYGQFFERYNDGQNVKEISVKLLADNQETIADPNDCNNFWFALAKAQWECKQLDNELLKRVKQIIETGADLEVWRQLDADKKDVAKRKIVLDKFLEELLSERPKAKARKKKTIREPVFAKGDCLTFKLANGNYGGAVVLEAIYNNEYGHNLIAITRINQNEKPTRKDFEYAEVLISNFGNWKNKENVRWYLPGRHKQTAHLIDKIGSIEVEFNYDISKTLFSHVGDFDIWIIEQADKQFQSEKSKERPSSCKKTIKELTKKKWKLW